MFKKLYIFKVNNNNNYGYYGSMGWYTDKLYGSFKKHFRN